LALDGFTQSDRERLVRVEAIQTTFMQQMDKRFKQVDKRFEELGNSHEINSHTVVFLIYMDGQASLIFWPR
jgi:hypothetical protein